MCRALDVLGCGFKLFLEKVVEEGSNGGQQPQLSQGLQGGVDGCGDDVSAQLKLQRQCQLGPELQPDGRDAVDEGR